MLKDQYASYDAETGTLKIGNARIEKTIRTEGRYIWTEKIEDKKTGSKWQSKKPLLQSCPVFGKDEIPEVTFETEFVEAPLISAPYLKATLRLCGKNGIAWYEYTVFSGIPFVHTVIYIERRGDVCGEVGIEASATAGGIESAPVVPDGGILCDSDTLDCIPLRRAHLQVTSVKLYDKTDINDKLVERSVFPLYSGGTTEREGNIFFISDVATEDSLILVKHSPTQSSALARKGNDIIIKGCSYVSLKGTGIDPENIPAGRTAYYSSAVGVASSSETYDELWRYSTASSSGDPRGELFIMSNTWGDRSQDVAVCESFMLEEIERAHALGVDIVQIDDGWESGITANSKRSKKGAWECYYDKDPDFWEVNTERFPNDLFPVIEKARGYGIEIGLWFSPDSSGDFAHCNDDIKTIMHLYEKYGVRYFKFDGINIVSKTGEERFIGMLKTLTEFTHGDIRFNLDVTAGNRTGYLYHTGYGTLFVENRYTDWGNYFPHNTFKNLWDLSSVLPARRLQTELLNNKRNRDKYGSIPFAPAMYGIDFIFAVTIPANPLLWMEMSHLDEADAKLLAEMISIYRPYRREIFESQVIPIGECPDGKNFSGYFCRNEDKKSGHLLLFRSSADSDCYTFRLPETTKAITQGDLNGYKLYESAQTNVTCLSDGIHVCFSEQRSFVWLRLP